MVAQAPNPCHYSSLLYEQMFLPRVLSDDLVARVARWDELKRWERREIGQTLRKMGLSYREIRAVVPVPKGTLSEWCADIDLSEPHARRLADMRPDLAALRDAGTRRRMEARRARSEIRSAGRIEALQLVRDPLWIAGAVAYWSEGSKTSSLRFTNSDDDLVRLFLRWGACYLDLSQERFTVSLHLHSGQDDEERKSFWSWRTGIPLERFGKTYIKPEGTGHRKNVLYAGTASVKVSRSGALLQRVLGWIDVLRTPD